MTDITTDLPDPSIHVLMGRVLAELPAIGKNQQNTAPGQNYSFRGIDDVMNALNPILSKHGVFYVPHDIEVLDAEHRVSGQGKAVYVTKIKVRYRFYGPNGDFVEAMGIGEGTDSLDKSAPKAMTGAMKYMLFETFAISTKEASNADADRDGGEETVVVPKDLQALFDRHKALTQPYRDKLTLFVQEKVWNGEDVNIVALAEPANHGWWPHYTKWIESAEKKVAEAQAEAAAKQQDADAEQPDAPAPEPEPQREPEPEPEPDGGTVVDAAARFQGTDPAPEPTPTPPDPTPAEPANSTPIMDDMPDDDGGTPDETDEDKQATYDEACKEIDGLRGPALQTQLRELGLPLGGKVDELRQRLKDYLHGVIFDGDGEDDTEPEAEAPATPDPHPLVDGGTTEDEWDAYAGQKITGPQVEIVKDVVNGLNDKGRDIYKAQCEKFGADPAKIEDWDQAQAFRMLAWFEETGLG